MDAAAVSSAERLKLVAVAATGTDNVGGPGSRPNWHSTGYARVDVGLQGHERFRPVYTPFEDVLELSDVISLHCPLTPATRNMIDAPEFAKMNKKPLLINTARGGLVSESALACALEGRISGAGIDVMPREPLSPGHAWNELLALPNFILTPHIAWASEKAVQALTDQLLENIEAFFEGRPRNVVRRVGSEQC